MTTRTYRKCKQYALVVDVLDELNDEDYKSVIGLLENLQELIEGYTPYNAYLDDKYADPVGDDITLT